MIGTEDTAKASFLPSSMIKQDEANDFWTKPMFGTRLKPWHVLLTSIGLIIWLKID